MFIHCATLSGCHKDGYNPRRRSDKDSKTIKYAIWRAGANWADHATSTATPSLELIEEETIHSAMAICNRNLSLCLVAHFSCGAHRWQLADSLLPPLFLLFFSSEVL